MERLLALRALDAGRTARMARSIVCDFEGWMDEEDARRKTAFFVA